MPFFGFLSLIFGIIVIAYPDFIAYILGFFFVFIGFNIIIASWISRRSRSGGSTSWKVGGYEIIKNRR